MSTRKKKPHAGGRPRRKDTKILHCMIPARQKDAIDARAVADKRTLNATVEMLLDQVLPPT